MDDGSRLEAKSPTMPSGTEKFKKIFDFVGKLGYLEELEHKYQLTIGIPGTDPEKLFRTVEEMVVQKGIKEKWTKRKDFMLDQTIDVTSFMAKLFTQYPEIIKEL